MRICVEHSLYPNSYVQTSIRTCGFKSHHTNTHATTDSSHAASIIAVPSSWKEHPGTTRKGRTTKTRSRATRHYKKNTRLPIVGEFLTRIENQIHVMAITVGLSRIRAKMWVFLFVCLFLHIAVSALVWVLVVDAFPFRSFSVLLSQYDSRSME